MTTREPRNSETFEPSPEARRMSRRKFLTRLGLGSLALTAVGAVSGVGAYILPRVNFEPPSAFTVGRPEDYEVGEMRLIESQAVFILPATAGCCDPPPPGPSRSTS